MRRSWSQTIRRRLGQALLAVYFAFAPSEAPQWRMDPDMRPVAMLAIGEPVPALVRSGGTGGRR